ncbi:FecR domain-containing protein [Bremerella sp.]|uniref:FecR domain-containing protein n=1 Tax=Bremerella sp. TaxID=2795602 RepID=UPI003919BF72
MNNKSRFVTLCNAVLEGQATQAEVAEFQETLRDDPAYRQAYREQMKIHAYLTWQHGRAAVDESLVISTSQDPPSTARTRNVSLVGLALSLLLIAAGLTGWWLSSSRGIPLVVISATDLEFAKGSRIYRKQIDITQGSLKFRLDSGAEVEAIGPVQLELVSDMLVRVVQGSVTVDVGDDAVGFQVETTEAQIVDLGTRFGVSVREAGETDVVVFEGAVDVHSNPGQSKPTSPVVNLKEGEAIRVDKRSGSKRLTSVVVRGDRDEVLAGNKDPSPVIVNITDNGEHKRKNRCYSVRIGGLGPPTKSYVGLGLPKWRPLKGRHFPDAMSGSDVVLMYSQDRYHPNLEYYVELSVPSRLFVWHDSRLNPPEWLTHDFQKTEMRLRSGPWAPSNDIISSIEAPEGEDIYVEYEVWQRDVPAGVVTLGGNDNQTNSLRFAMYGIAAKALEN